VKLHSTNPSRNYEVIGSVTVSTKEDVEKAVAKARKAFPIWSTLSIKQRSDILESYLAIAKKRSEEIAQQIAEETGRPITSARGNVAGGISYFESYIAQAEKILSPQVTVETAKEKHMIYHEPRGVIAVISPWNYPFMNVTWQCGQALLAGNTIVYKNSEENPLFAKLLEELIHESDIPEGVFNILYGDGKVGQMLVEQNIDMISFTGSSATGRKLAVIGAEKFIPVVLELGGSSPMIIFEDVEITDETIAFIFGRRFKNAGQACDAVKRLIVHESKYDEVVLGLQKYIATQKIGDALDEDTEVGPLVAERQVKLIEEQVQDAVTKGAKIISGGKRPEGLKGAYYEATLLTNINPTMRVWHEETFGPVLPVVSFATEEKAIAMANHTDYGLTAHIMTNDVKRFNKVALQIKAGSIGQNEVMFWNPQNPFGGYKLSGMGRTHGEAGFNEVTQIKVVSAQK
jgi:succinate-semialdehyde dehydrogenase/glutarate-semialdehyde dehydrogenase